MKLHHCISITEHVSLYHYTDVAANYCCYHLIQCLYLDQILIFADIESQLDYDMYNYVAVIGHYNYPHTSKRLNDGYKSLTIVVVARHRYTVIKYE